MKNIKKFFVSPIILIGLTFYYFADAIFFNKILSFRDLSRYFYPLRLFTINSVKSAILPLWNPYIFCGTPHLALQQSVIFYPLSLIYYIFPFGIAFNLFLIIHIFLAGTFVFLLCRRWGFREGASLLAAIIFMFNGYSVFILNLATTLSSVIWLPIILLFFDKALACNAPKYLCISAIFLGVMFLGGEPSIFYSTLWVLLFYSVFFWSNNKEIHLSKVAIYYFLAAAFGILLSAIQLIPFLELMKFADRTTGREAYEYLTKWSLPLKDTFSFIIPFLARTDFSKESYWKEQNWVILIYLGVFAILLIILACFFKKNWRVNFLIFIGLLFLFLSYGSSTPFYYFVYKFIPGFKFVRYPVRFLYVTIFAVSIICGAGFDAYIDGRERRDKRLGIFFKYVLIVLYLFAIIFLALHIYKNELIAIAHNFCARHLDLKTQGGVLFSLIGAIVNIKRFSGFLTAGGLLLFLALKVPVRRSVLNFAFISLVVADLFSAIPGRHIGLDSKLLNKATTNIEYLKKDPSFFRFYVAPKTREADTFLKGKTYEEAIQAAKDRLSANWPIMHGLHDAYGYDSIRLKRYINLMTTVETSGSPSATRILDMLNVKYLVIQDKLDAKGYKLVNSGSAYIYENTNVLPRAFLAGSFKVLKNETDIANALKSEEFDPSKEVILEEEPVVKTIDHRPQTTDREGVEIIKYSPNEVEIKTILNSPKFLVLSDQYYPGWKAYVDGKKEKIYIADYVLRAVYLEPGVHIARFVFDPFSFKIGLILTLGTLGFIIFYIVYKKI